jgi:U3 small nucleolar ribonucleoprotein protein IMP4
VFLFLLSFFSVTEGREIPTDLRHGALALSRAAEWDDEGGEYMTSHEDDEYGWAGVQDPKIVITTSRDPSSRLKMFAKVMSAH